MEATLKEEQKEIEGLIKLNCELKDYPAVLPETPWFVRASKHHEVRNTLQDLLFECERSVSAFSQKAAEVVLRSKEQADQEKAAYATYLRDNVDLRKRIEELEQVRDSRPSTIALNLFKAQSHTGPVTVVFTFNEEQRGMEEGDKVELLAALLPSGKLEFFSDGQSLGSCEAPLQNFLKTHPIEQLSEKPEFTLLIEEKKQQYSVVMELRIVPSQQDRYNTLYALLAENEPKVHAEKPAERLFVEYLTALGLEYTESGFASRMEAKQSGGPPSFCESCLLV